MTIKICEDCPYKVNGKEPGREFPWYYCGNPAVDTCDFLKVSCDMITECKYKPADQKGIKDES